MAIRQWKENSVLVIYMVELYPTTADNVATVISDGLREESGRAMGRRKRMGLGYTLIRLADVEYHAIGLSGG